MCVCVCVCVCLLSLCLISPPSTSCCLLLHSLILTVWQEYLIFALRHPFHIVSGRNQCNCLLRLAKNAVSFLCGVHPLGDVSYLYSNQIAFFFFRNQAEMWQEGQLWGGIQGQGWEEMNHSLHTA